MDCTFAVQGKDYILLAADKSAISNSIMKLNNDDTKILQLSNNRMLATVGETFDKKNFAKLIKANLDLYKYQNGVELNTSEIASYIRNDLAESIRKNPVQCNCLVAGFDGDEPKLYWFDYLGSYAKLLKAAHGYGAYFLYGLMDNYYKANMSLEEGELIIDKCINELNTRFSISLSKFDVFKITKQGIENISEKFNRRA